MKNTYFKTLLVFIILSSCSDIDETPYSFFTQENFLKNETELTSQALGLYDFQPNSFFEDQMFNIVTMPSKYFASRNRNLTASSVIYGNGSSDISYEAAWETFYKIVGRANTIIRYAENAEINTSPETINQFKAEAHFFRAYCYFHLVRIWGNVPLVKEPIESNEPQNINTSNSEVTEIYNLIVNDLQFAAKHLPLIEWENSPPGRVRAATAIQLLGLVYITMAGKPLEATENYQNAINTLEELTQNEITYGVSLLSNWMDNFSLDNKVNSEKLFALGSTNIAGFGSVLPFRITPPGQVGYARNGAYQYAVSYELYELFEEEDIRKQNGFLFSYNLANGNTVTYQPDNNSAPRDYGGLNGLSHLKYTDGSALSPITHTNETFYMRYVETFLILAEAYNEIGNSSKSLENLNKVRSRANASIINVTDQDLLRQEIRNERKRELFHEFTELYDMRRWGTVEENFINHPLRIRWNPSAVWEERFKISPIPLSEISRNTNLAQNSGW